MKLSHEFFGSGEYANRRSEVWCKRRWWTGLRHDNKGTWYLNFFENDSLVDHRNIIGRTERYAEDCAENWVIGVIK